MRTNLIVSFLLLSLYEVYVWGARTTENSKHLFVQRTEPVRGSSLPVHEIRLSENGSFAAESQENVHHRSSRRRRSAQSEGATNTNPTETMVSCSREEYFLLSCMRTPGVVGWTVGNELRLTPVAYVTESPGHISTTL